MQKYVRFVETKFYIISVVIAVIAALVVTGYLAFQAMQPMDVKELQKQHENLQLLKEDFSNIDCMENAKRETENGRIIVTFDGEDSSMKCYFDEHGTYLYRIISDNRITSNFAKCLMCVVCTFVSVWAVMTFVEILLYIPACGWKLYILIKEARKKWN